MFNRILITGNAGFIGSSLSERLLAEGAYIIGVDNFDGFYAKDIKLKNLKKQQNFNKFKFYEADIRNKIQLEEIFKNNNIQLVVHLAAKAGVRPSIELPYEYNEVNIGGTINLLDLMKKYHVKNMIFASSSSVYGNNKKMPFSEEDNVDYPISPYAASKKACELFCFNYHHLYNFNISCLRFFTVYGPRQRPEMAFHKFIKSIKNRETIEVFAEGKSSRDYTYISDIVNGIILSINNLNGYEIFNLGNSYPIQLLDVLGIIETLVHEKIQINLLPSQPGDVDITYADISKAQKKLNYSPVVTLNEGLKKFVNWFENEK